MSVKELMNKSVDSIKVDGIGGFSKKTLKYIKFKTLYKKGYEKAYQDVLFINGCYLPHPQRYRVAHQMEQLESSGFSCEEVFYEQLNMDSLKYYRAFVFFRCPITDTIEEFINKAKEYNKLVIFDIDDLVIDTKYTDNIEFVSKMNKEDKAVYDDGVNRMQKTLKMCDCAITTTDRLAKELKNYTKEVFINRNVASEKMVELSLRANKNKKEHDGVVLGYLSGSITHNPDVELIKKVLIKLMDKYDFLKLRLCGELTIPDEFKKYSDRVITSSFTDWQNLPELISNIDINLAPLEDTIFNEAKSENKWTEASLCKTVTVASDVGAFKDTIRNGVDGFLCKNEKQWEEVLTKLIEDKELREEISTNAYNRVMKEYITTYTGHNLKEFIKKRLARNIMFVLPTTNISGGVNVIIRHMNMLIKAGWDVCVINLDKNDEDIISKWGTINVIKSDKMKILGYVDTMVASLWATLKYVKECPNVKNKCYLVQNYETDFGYYGQEMRSIANSTYEDETGVRYLTISKWCQNWLKDTFDKDSEYVPNGIDLNQFQYKDRDFKGKIKILIEGNSSDYYKNVDESFKIIDKLDKSKIEVQYLSYQGEPKKWYYVDKFLHKVPYAEVGKIYQGADILLKTSILESFSYPPLEMMATGGLVVVAPNGGNIEYIKDNENCLFYEPGNIDDAVEKINKLISDESLRDKLIKNGIKTAKRRDWDIIEKDIIKMYEGK